MYRHVVLWKFKSNEDSDREKVKNALYALLPLIPEIKKMAISKDIGHTPMSFDLMLDTEFDNEEDYKVYAVHPEHMKVKEIVHELICDRVTLDCEE